MDFSLGAPHLFFVCCYFKTPNLALIVLVMIHCDFNKFHFSFFKKKRSNTSLGPLSFMFVSHRSFKFLRFQIDPLSFEFVSDRSFKFIRFQIGPLSFEFVSDKSFNFGLTEVDRKNLSETNSNLKDPSET